MSVNQFAPSREPADQGVFVRFNFFQRIIVSHHASKRPRFEKSATKTFINGSLSR
jgi:hypothetical protein